MARAKTHKDVDFAVDGAGGKQHVFKKFDEAAAFATFTAATMGTKVNLDVLVWSKAGARFYEGEEGVEKYNEDPEASVFERLEINVNYVGRVA